MPCSTKVRAAYPAEFPPPTITYLRQQKMKTQNRVITKIEKKKTVMHELREAVLAILIGERGVASSEFD